MPASDNAVIHDLINTMSEADRRQLELLLEAQREEMRLQRIANRWANVAVVAVTLVTLLLALGALGR